MEIYALGLLIILGLIWLALRVSKSSGYKEAKLETSEAENETIKENIKATAIKEHELATASDDERIRLRKKWSKSKP
jgi:uncharacterized protein YpmB